MITQKFLLGQIEKNIVIDRLIIAYPIKMTNVSRELTYISFV